VVQVYRATAVGNSLARGFRETRRKIGVPDADEIVFRSDEKIGDDLVRKLAGRYGNGVILLWLGMDDFSWLAGAVADHGPITVFASSTVLGEKFSELPEKVRLHAYFTYPYRFPEDRSGAMHVVRPWLKIKGIPEKNLSISSRMYFIGRVLTDTFMHMQRHYYRDHFLDVIDMLEDESHTIADYPRLSFGPGQRYASKGCYIVQLSAGEKPEILRKSDWVVH